MKKLWQKASFRLVLVIGILGGSATAYIVKQAGKNPDAGVVVNGDTLLQSTGDSIKTAPDTAKLKP